MMKGDRNRDEGSADRDARIPMLRLEKYLLDELPSGEKAGLEAEAARDPRLAAALAEMRETRSNLDWLGLRGSLESRSPAAAAGAAHRSGPARVRSSLRGLWERRNDGWGGLGRPKLAWAGAFAVLLLLAPAALAPFKGDSGFRAKGHARAEVVLEIDGAKVVPGGTRSVKDGAVLGFSYRSLKPLYTQIWYREDGGAPSLFDGRSDSSLYWPASSGWTPAPQRIRLEGQWKAQRVIILASPDRIGPEDARKMILGEMKPGKRAGLFTYDLLRP